ncbi:hypothetical protein G4B88_028727 [Cannabis sativa]|uniref:peptide-methionine (S)-S-oxide reductase n=1 Tax=Cannabis sativa TaxID=3483 RepID=A0A7J6EW74_CANSA|nr:hypothetical protein G4B88_028727 [Cannabis sativa]
MLKNLALTTTTASTTPFMLISTTGAFSLSKPFIPSLSNFRPKPISSFPKLTDPFLSPLGFASKSPEYSSESSSIAQGPDEDVPAQARSLPSSVPAVSGGRAGFPASSWCFQDRGTTNHSEVVRVQYDPKECSYESLLDAFFARHDPTTPNRQGNDVGTQYRSGIYYYTPEQEKIAKESLEKYQKQFSRKIVTEILPAKRFYRAEEYHQQYLAKGGRFGFKQSTEKGCNDPIRCYG